MMTDDEVAELVRLAEGVRVVEVGACMGGSTVALARVADHVVSIDHHRGDPWTGPIPTLSQYLEVLDNSGVRSRVTVVLDDWRNALALIDPRWPILVFLDAEHDADSVHQQLVMAAALDPWVICVHDFGQWTVKQGVERWVGSVKPDTHLVDGLLVMTMPAS
jgi:predicted O-methyltransferase YrrM